MRKKVMLLSLLFFTSGLLAEEAKVYTWEDCIKAALTGNYELLSSKEQIEQSKASKGSVRSNLLPSLDANAGYERSKSQSSDAANRYSYGLSGKQLIFDGLESLYNLKTANADIETSRYGHIVTSASVRYSLKTAFVNLLKAQEMVAILEEIQTRRKHVMDLVKIKYDSGREHKGSYDSAKADYLSAVTDVKSAKRDVELSRTTLSFLMGLGTDNGLMAKGDLIISADYEKKPDLAAIALKSPSYLKSSSETNAALLSLQASKSAFSPQLSASGNVGRSGAELNDMDYNWSLGLSVSAPLFSGGSTWYGYKKAEAVYNQKLLDEKNTKNNTIKILEESWNQLMDDIENVDVQLAILNANMERSRIGEAQYSIGTLSFDNWTIIENNLSNAKRTYLNACAQALLSEAKWINSIGGTLDNEIPE